MPASTPVSVALIGYGYSGKTFHAPLIGAVPGLQLTLIASSDPHKVHIDLPGIDVIADPFAAATASGIDLVVIASPNDSHAPLARAALLAGKHVVVDKPFTLDLAEARDLTATAAHCDRILSVFHNRRWDSDFLTIQQAIADGLVGTVKHFASSFDRFRPVVRDRWREQDGPGAGIWFDIGPHLVDQMLLLFGLPDLVTGHLAQLRPGALSDDWAHVVFDYPQRRVVLQASMIVAGGSDRFVVHGDGGSIVKRMADRQEAQLLSGMIPGSPDWGNDPDPLIVHDPGGTQTLMASQRGDQKRFYERLVEAIKGVGPSPVNAAQAVGVMACIEAAAISARENRSMGIILSDAERAVWANG